MINNRQNGRRRGRGGQQARNGQPGGPDRGNRLDNRARGNAAQLLEKYKNLARDAQMQGDRVNTEYYLQFADHYFRVLNENRARFEEQRPRQNDYRDEFGGDEDGGDAGGQRYQGRDDQSRDDQNRDDQSGDDSWDDGDQPQFERRDSRDERRDSREERQVYAQQGDGERQRAPERTADRERAPERAPRAANGEGRRERGRRSAAPATQPNGNGFSAPDFLNEPIAPRLDLEPSEEVEAKAPAPDIVNEAVEEAAPKRRRTRRPRGEASPAEA